MMPPIRLLLLICFVTLVTGCATGYSKRQVLESGSQVELRSYQTRSYDTSDRIRVLRSIMATLQDLGFVIDKADDVVGVVSATKLDGYAMSMTVSVRASGDQTNVRANAQYNLKAVEEPGPYQDFFTALDKGLFLDRNILAGELPSSATTTNAAGSVVPMRQSDTSAEAAVSVYDFYGEAEEEIYSESYDKDLWARALVVAEGDEQKRKARYIELRAGQLLVESGPVGLPGQAEAARITNQTVASNDSQVAIAMSGTGQVKPTPVNDNISGRYVAEFTSTNPDYIATSLSNLVFTLEQSGNRISGMNDDLKLKISGTRQGDRIDFIVEPHRFNRFQNQQGTMTINRSGDRLEGSWKIANLGVGGQWNLSRIGSQSGAAAASTKATAHPGPKGPVGYDLTGSYYSKIGGSYKGSNVRSIYITQTGNQITGQSPGKEWEIEGEVNGSEVRFKWFNHENKGKGKFTVDTGGNLVGDYTGDSWGQGTWELTRLN